MPKFEVLGGDFKEGIARLTFRNFSLPSFNAKAYFDTVSLSDVTNIYRANSEILDLLVKDKEHLEELKQNNENVIFVTTFKDQRRFIGSSENMIYLKLVEAYKKMKNFNSSPQEQLAQTG